MTEKLRALYFRMLEMDKGQPKLIQHFTKVHSYAKLIAESEALPLETVETIEAAALVHDIAIPLCISKYGSDSGSLQEIEGPALAKALLAELAFPAEIVERVASLVGEHHTYDPIDGIDHQILVEADFLVNNFESNVTAAMREMTLNRVFKTEAGKRIYRLMFGITP